MNDQEEHLDELTPAESLVYTRVMRALFSSIPQPSEIKPEDYLPLPRALGRCPECGGMLEFHFLDAKEGRATISVGFRCLDMDLRQHHYHTELWSENNKEIGGIIQSFYFLKWHGLTFGRRPNEEERKYVAWILEDYEARSGEGTREDGASLASEGNEPIDSDASG